MQSVGSFIHKTTKLICIKPDIVGSYWTLREYYIKSYRSLTLHYITLHYTTSYLGLLQPQFVTLIFKRSFRTSDNADYTAILNTTNKLYSSNC